MKPHVFTGQHLRPVNRPGSRLRLISLTPLIDVVTFVLHIFFMPAGRLAASDPLGIVPPKSSSDAPPRKQETAVFAAVDGRFALNGETIDESDLKTSVAQRMAAASAEDLHLRAAGRAKATRIVAIMEKLRKAGVEKLRQPTVPVGR